jgi:hypothetical protein
MQNLIPSIISAGDCLRLFQNFALRQPSVEKMRKLYELAAPFIESKVTFKCGGWDINLYLSRENYLHIVEEYAKLENKDGGYVGKEHAVPPIIHNDYYVPRELLEKCKPITLENINLGKTECPQTIIYTG